MTKEVLICIRGMQSLDHQKKDTVETVSEGTYYYRNGHHYILFEETVDGEIEPIRNRIKIGKGFFEVTKSGLSNVHMYFKEQEKTLSNYETPYGVMMIDFDTKEIKVKEEAKKIEVQVSYGLELDEEHLADCKLNISISTR